jgi:hypothetical protein
MKYKLEPNNRNCPDAELLSDLCAVANGLNKPTITKEDYDKHGRFCSATMRKRFGSWNKALAQCGLTVQKRIDIPGEELIADLKRVASEIGMQTVTREDYRQNGNFSEATLVRQFGNWAGVLSAANLKPTGWKPSAKEEDLFDNMATVWEHVGRQPKQKDFIPPVSKYSDATYVNRFGSWRAALEAFVAYTNLDNSDADVAVESTSLISVAQHPKEPQHRTGRNPSWRLRFLVMRRDKFRCFLCGATQNPDQNIRLDIDHIVPWTSGGETMMSNLQTLCNRCNVGKSNLSMNDD